MSVDAHVKIDPLVPANTPESRVRIERVPLYIGAGDAPRLAWYHVPEVRSDQGVVICPPLGHEYISAYRSLREMADRLAATGVAVLRFDYHGTGDSAGEDDDPDRMTVWQQDIREAMGMLRALYGCTRTSLVGLRMGASLAVQVAEQTDVASLVLWAPCLRGRTYAREMKLVQLTADPRASEAQSGERPLEAGGFLYAEQTVRDFGQLDLLRSKPRVQRALIVARDDMNEDSSLREAWLRQGLEVYQRRLPGCAEMLAEPHNTQIPHAAIDEIVKWIARDNDAADAHETPAPATMPLRDAAVVEGAVRETLLRFGIDGDSFGILCEPVVRPAHELPTILLLNAGATHRVGPNRIYVRLARALARAGFRSLRIDLRGLGDSATDDPAQENRPYTPTATREAAAAIGALQQRGIHGPFVLMGLCSGAHAVFHAGLELTELPISECVLINPLVFYWKDGISLDQPSAEHAGNWTWYAQSARDPKRWLRLLRGQADLSAVFDTVRDRARMLGQRWKATGKRWVGYKPSNAEKHQLEDDLDKLAEHGRKLTFMFSSTDPGYELLMVCARRTVRRLMRSGGVTISFIENADHTFTARSARQAMIESLRAHLSKRYAAPK
jgi:alpha-beta hydrolase superfamily lysophospholipase